MHRHYYLRILSCLLLRRSVIAVHVLNTRLKQLFRIFPNKSSHFSINLSYQNYITEQLMVKSSFKALNFPCSLFSFFFICSFVTLPSPLPLSFLIIMTCKWSHFVNRPKIHFVFKSDSFYFFIIIIFNDCRPLKIRRFIIWKIIHLWFKFYWITFGLIRHTIYVHAFSILGTFNYNIRLNNDILRRLDTAWEN